MKETKNPIISVVAVVAVLLLIAGVVSVSFSYASLNNVNMVEKKWDIYFTEPIVDSTIDNNIVVTGSAIDFSIDLRNGINEYEFQTSINNDGNIDAILSELNTTKFNEVVVGSTSTGSKTLADFFDFEIKYATTNAKNGTIQDRNVLINDKLNHGTSNKINVKVSLKKNLNLSEEEREVLTNISTLNIKVNAIYSEAK